LAMVAPSNRARGGARQGGGGSRTHARSAPSPHPLSGAAPARARLPTSGRPMEGPRNRRGRPELSRPRTRRRRRRRRQARLAARRRGPVWPAGAARSGSGPVGAAEPGEGKSAGGRPGPASPPRRGADRAGAARGGDKAVTVETADQATGAVRSLGPGRSPRAHLRVAWPGPAVAVPHERCQLNVLSWPTDIRVPGRLGLRLDNQYTGLQTRTWTEHNSEPELDRDGSGGSLTAPSMPVRNLVIKGTTLEYTALTHSCESLARGSNKHSIHTENLLSQFTAI
jgi:hypothetical protein